MTIGQGEDADRTRDPTVDTAEVARFAALADRWWDMDGAFRPLHWLNPIRIRYLRDHLARRTGRDPDSANPLSGLTVLDIGCGGGLLCEPLVRLGAFVTGLDAAERSLQVARLHAARMGLEINYIGASVVELASTGRRFDAVLAMEVIEHVADPPAFIAAAMRLLAPDGDLFLSTLNRTFRSFALAVAGAEYLLRWLPRGTHDWRCFVKPSELEAMLRPGGFRFAELTGVVYRPWSRTWALDANDLSVNYMGLARRLEGPGL